MKKVFIRDLEEGRPVQANFLLRNKTAKTTRGGTPYLDLDLQDSSGVIAAKVWEYDEAGVDYGADDVVYVRGVVEKYEENLQLRVEEIHKSRHPEIDLRDFLPQSVRDPEEMYAALLDRVRRMGEGPLLALVGAVVEDPTIAAKFKLAPAATNYHHAYLGGLLEHVLSLVELGDKVCDHYPSLDRELVLAGLVLHDLGKIAELEFAAGFRYSTRGQLVGHMAIALEFLSDKMRAIPEFPAGLKDQIEHIVLSHHGKLEFGSPKAPMFPEALVVHYLDDLDSKLASMRAQYAADKNRPGEWTARNRALGRELFKKGERA